MPVEEPGNLFTKVSARMHGAEPLEDCFSFNVNSAVTSDGERSQLAPKACGEVPFETTYKNFGSWILDVVT